jgi:hypothetical protein
MAAIQDPEQALIPVPTEQQGNQQKEAPKRNLVQKGLVIAALAATGLVLVSPVGYFVFRNVALGSIENPNPRVGLPLWEGGGFVENIVRFDWNDQEYEVKQRVFEPAPVPESQLPSQLQTTIIVGGDRMPQSYAAYNMMAMLSSRQGIRSVIAGSGDKDGAGKLNGKNGWGSEGDEIQAIETQLINEIDLLAEQGNNPRLNILVESAGTAVLAQALAGLAERIQAIRVTNENFEPDVRIVINSPALDVERVIEEGARRMGGPAGFLFEFLASEAIDYLKPEIKDITTESIAQNLKDFASMVDTEVLIIAAAGDTTTRIEEVDELYQLLDDTLDIRMMRATETSAVGEWHVPGVHMFSFELDGLDPEDVDQVTYYEIVNSTDATNDYLDFIYGNWDDLQGVIKVEEVPYVSD